MSTTPTARELQLRRAIRNVAPQRFNSEFVRYLAAGIDKEMTREAEQERAMKSGEGRRSSDPNRPAPLRELPKGSTLSYLEKGEPAEFDPNPRFQAGDRFVSRDKRDGERIVQVTKVLGIEDKRTWEYLDRILFRGLDLVYGQTRAERAEWMRQRSTRYWVRNEKTGRTVKVQENTLREKFRQLPATSSED